MSERGLFILATKPVPARSLMEVEIRVLGEPAPILAIGRVVWTREANEGKGRPAGMGVKLIDMEDAARALIARLVAGRQPTMHGIGAAPAPPACVAPLAVRPMEPSIPFHLVTKKPAPVIRPRGRARDLVARLLVAAILLGFVLFGPRDSRVAATHGATTTASPLADAR